MIILDTNVISALMVQERDATVLAWLDRQSAASMWTTSITVFEIRFGLGLLPFGKRRRSLEEAFSRTLNEDLDGRVLSFEEDAARHAAELGARRRLAGRPMDFRDAEIAGIVAARHATLATRNTKDFDGVEIDLTNPWSDLR